ncbi:MAG: tRNA glutamyl-Q(34) synthetase GluQRS [Burkholderiales bacterium]|nr:tRNA glutamyl-Q(34) synthetase GluQRS [Burkholderiales bacterium]
MNAPPVPYRGRFAPTPSGPLHFGSIVAAAGSFLDARAHGGAWHLRIDDLDPPRTVPGAADAIITTLDRFGFQWDGPVVRQSARTLAYATALQSLAARAHVYRCTCSRTEIARSGLPGIEGPRYPGTCRGGPSHPGRTAARRLDVRDVTVTFEDRLQGAVTQSLEAAIGGCVLQRADGVLASLLACAVDDADAGFTHVVRGADLLASTPRQIHLQRLLGYPTPAYSTWSRPTPPVSKLSKQTRAAPVDDRTCPTLLQVLVFRTGTTRGMDRWFARRSVGLGHSRVAHGPRHIVRIPAPALTGRGTRVCRTAATQSFPDSALLLCEPP